MRGSAGCASLTFDAHGKAALTTLFAGRRIEVVYHNPAGLECGAYQIVGVRVDGKEVAVQGGAQARLDREQIIGLEAGETHRIEVELG
jgi:cellobiose phosphorylase